jgi:hypothetical protein
MILSEEESFKSEKEKVWYSEVGYEDTDFQEDLEQEQKFKSNYDKRTNRPKRKPSK